MTNEEEDEEEEHHHSHPCSITNVQPSLLPEFRPSLQHFATSPNIPRPFNLRDSRARHKADKNDGKKEKEKENLSVFKI